MQCNAASHKSGRYYKPVQTGQVTDRVNPSRSIRQALGKEKIHLWMSALSVIWFAKDCFDVGFHMLAS